MTEPWPLFNRDRCRARHLADAMVDRCVVATVDQSGTPQLRTLVLRDIDGDLALFCNATSAKCSEFENSEAVGVLVYWPSVQVQYRLSAKLSRVPSGVVAGYWKRKPLTTRKVDWLYQALPQGTAVANRKDLLTQLSEINDDDVSVAPPTVTGYTLDVLSLERLDLSMDDGIHDRRRFTLSDGQWRCEVLVP